MIDATQPISVQLSSHFIASVIDSMSITVRPVRDREIESVDENIACISHSKATL